MLNKLLSGAAAAASLWICAGSAIAQTAPCELHLWPAGRMKSETTGLLSTFGGVGEELIDRAAHASKDAHNRAHMRNTLDSQVQLDTLQSLDLATLLSLPAGTQIVRHDQPLDRKTITKVKTRRSDSKAACYSELITAEIAYHRGTIAGRTLTTLFAFRDFGSQDQVQFAYKARGKHHLMLFPAKKGEDAHAALDELRAAFGKDLEGFTGKQQKAVAKHRRAAK
jgi:hypothetical protein